MSAQSGWEAIELIPGALSEANSTRELRSRLDRSRGISDNTAHSLFQMGKSGEAVRAIEAGRVHLLRNELKMLEAKLAPDDLSELLGLRRQLADKQSLFNSQSNTLYAAAGGLQSEDLRASFDSSQRDLREARMSFDAFAQKHGFGGNSVPKENDLRDAFQGELGPGAAVVISVSLNGTLIFVLPNGQANLEDAQVSTLASFDSASLSDLLSDDENGWFARYTRLQNELQAANRSARNKSYEDALPAYASAMHRWNDYLTEVLERLWRDLMGAVDQALNDAGVEPGSPISLIVPGQLSVLPLHAAGVRNDQGWQCFFDRWEPSFVPSLQVLASLRRRASLSKSSTARLLAITDPLGDLGANKNPATTAFPENSIIDLPHDRATRSTIHKHISECNYASFYCHGVWDNENPDESALILAKD